MRKIILLSIAPFLLVFGIIYLTFFVVPDEAMITDSTKLNVFLDGVGPEAIVSFDARGKFRVIEADGNEKYVDVEMNSATVKVLEQRNYLSSGGNNPPPGPFPGDIAISIILTLISVFVIACAMKKYLGRKADGADTEASAHRPGTRFSDVAGLVEVKQELNEILEFLKNPEKYRDIGARMPTGVILYGPPGTGKTLLAKALAGEADASFHVASGSEFVEKYVGVGASRVRELFTAARKEEKAIVFIDEIDAVGKKRSNDVHSNEEKDVTLNQLLIEMDGFNDSSTIVVVGATNRFDLLDPALLRPGRFDRHIAVDVPSYLERVAILEVHMRNKPAVADVDLEKLAQRTPGFTGADLSNMCNEAAIIAAREDKKIIDAEDFEKAIDRVVAGLERKSKILSSQEKKVIAIHESGHALATFLLKNETIHRISILPRGKAMGFVMQTSEYDKSIYNRQDLLDKIKALLGGRAAEEMEFGDISSGGKNDLEKATQIALSMVAELGMSPLGQISYANLLNSVYHVPDALYDNAKIIIDECYQYIRTLLQENRGMLLFLTDKLLINETLSGDEVRHMLLTFEGN